jgi:ABC-type iron transport system FetAB permease component
MPGSADKYSILIFSHNFSIELRFNTHYEYNVLTRQTRTTIKIIISHFVLPFVLAEIHTSRSEALDKHRTRK